MGHPDTWGKLTSPYHAGEREIHRRYGIYHEQTEMTRSVYSQALTGYHRDFLSSLPYLVIGSVDGDGRPWASIVSGPPGFVHATEAGDVVTVESRPVEGDRLAGEIIAGRPISIVGIDLAAKRRIRANGTTRTVKPGGFDVEIAQAYNNCPQYIQGREAHEVRPGTELPAASAFGANLPERVVELIQMADTFFVASNNPRDDQTDVGGTDVNHRGGPPGFVMIEDNVITVPDYSGNLAFNTLGNFLVDPRAGLLFVDFEQGDLVQLTGTTEIIWEGSEVERFPAAQRAWRVVVEAGTLLRRGTQHRWNLRSLSRHATIIPAWSEGNADTES